MNLLRLIPLALMAVAPLPALAQEDNDDIVVRGALDQPSDWREAETEHVIVVSSGSEAELIRIAHNLERLHFLLSVLLDRFDKPDDTIKLRVTLVGNTAEFDAMDLRNLRSRQGPFAHAFPIQRYYDPREDGAVMANTRIDQRVTLQQGVSLASLGITSLDPVTGLLESNLFGLSSPSDGVTVNAVTVPLPAAGRLYAGYAQHYLLTYFPNAYPRWYLDGFGEIFATMRVRDDGALEYGRPPEGFSKVTNWFRDYPLKDVLNGRYLEARANTRWTPFHAWVLVHYLFFSEERRGQLTRYLAAYARGASLDQAVQAFGDMGRLQRDLLKYDNSKVPYERMTYPPDRAAGPVVHQLTRGQAAFVKGRLELGSRIEIPAPALSGGDARAAARFERGRAQAIAARDRWLARLRGDAARYPASLEAQLLLAEAECRIGNSAQCLAAADRALAADAGSSAALAWKGVATAQQAVAGPESERRERLRAARALIARANRADTESVVPLLAYFRSFADAGEAPPDVALEGLLKTIDSVPAAPGPRLMLGEEFVRQGNREAARRTLLPVVNGAYDSPERPKAEAVLASASGD